MTPKPHPRYKVFSQNGKPILKAVLFSDDAKLRSHVIKHFGRINTLLGDSDPRWHVARKTFYGALEDLKKMGCPYLKTKSETPPCKTKSGPCRFFDKDCASFLGKFEQLYLELCENVIKAGLAIPRTVFFLAKKKKGRFLLGMPAKPIVAVLRKEGPLHHLKTCYCLADDFSLARRTIVRRVRRDCADEPLWKTKTTWGIAGGAGWRHCLDVRK